MEKVKVLVTGSGSIVGQGIIKSLKLANNKKDSNLKYEIVAADMSALSAGIYRSDFGTLIPPASSCDYIEFIERICKELGITAIFAGSDEELLPLVRAKDQLERKTGTLILTNPSQVISICMDKWRTFEFLKSNNLPFTESALPESKEQFVRDFGFPIFVKPRQGHGSLHCYTANSKEELDSAILAIERVGWRPILQEYLDGQNGEFTSGITVNKAGKKIMSSIAMKRTIKSGQTYKAFVDDFKEVRKSAEKVVIKLGSTNAVNVQAKLINDEVKIFEINPRFSATLPIRAVAGVNEPDIIFRNNVLGEEVEIDSYQKLVCMRYWNEVYVPYSTYEMTQKVGKVEKVNSFTVDYF